MCVMFRFVAFTMRIVFAFAPVCFTIFAAFLFELAANLSALCWFTTIFGCTIFCPSTFDVMNFSCWAATFCGNFAMACVFVAAFATGFVDATLEVAEAVWDAATTSFGWFVSVMKLFCDETVNCVTGFCLDDVGASWIMFAWPVFELDTRRVVPV